MFSSSSIEVFDKNQLSGTTTWLSPSNIALIKYWGKKNLQVPINPSLSFTLKECLTETTVSYKPSSEGFKYEFYFENKLKPSFNNKLDIFFKRIIQYLPFLNQVSLKISSNNTFPHSSGIASSASAFSALSLCLVDIEKSLVENTDFYKKSSFIARLGSGSACRSIYASASFWGKSTLVDNSKDDYAIAFDLPKFFNDYNDTILIVDEKSKSISSSVGHNLVKDHHFKSSRINQANKNLENLLHAIQNQNSNEFISVVENEALTLHAMMLSSNPSFILLKPNTINIINKIWTFRKENNTSLCFTLDAGANIHLLYHQNDFVSVQKFVKSELVNYCSNGKYINDKVGPGPIKK